MRNKSESATTDVTVHTLYPKLSQHDENKTWVANWSIYKMLWFLVIVCDFVIRRARLPFRPLSHIAYLHRFNRRFTTTTPMIYRDMSD